MFCLLARCENLVETVARSVQVHSEFKTPGKEGIRFSFAALEISLLWFCGRKGLQARLLQNGQSKPTTACMNYFVHLRFIKLLTIVL